MHYSKPKHLSILVLLVFFLFACNSRKNEAESVVSDKIDSHVNLIDTLKAFTIGQGWLKRELSSNLKIVTYIDGTCGQCLYDLIKWKDLIIKLNSKEIDFIFFIKTYNLEQILEILTQVEFEYPVIIDYKNLFYSINKLDDNKIFQTYLLNNNDKVLLVGNPILSPKMKDLYLKVIDKYGSETKF